jgi:translation elongation factor EF-Tu-like GTPase
MLEQPMERPRDIEARIYFLTTDEGGRHNSVLDGYRPQFYYDSNDWDAIHEYPDGGYVNLGETARVYLSFLRPHKHVGKIYEGMEFLIKEGSKTVGRGKVTKIIDLLESAKTAEELERNQTNIGGRNG